MFIGVFKSNFNRYAESMRLIYVMVVLILLSGCNGGGNSGSKTGPNPRETFGKDASYALGMNLGANFKAENLYPNIEELVQGIRDALSGAETKYTIEQAYMILNEAFDSLAEEREAENRRTENEYLAENSKKPGVNVTGSGLQYEVIHEGNGPRPTAFDTVRVHYEGALTNGAVFDSSYSRGEPIEFPLNAVIPGWTEGLQLMGVGSKYRLIIPSDLGYGPQGAGPQIPPYSTLIFEVDLLDIIR
jgi:FKBP-type peptidyl-prolyl cis-trans isomerase